MTSTSYDRKSCLAGAVLFWGQRGDKGRMSFSASRQNGILKVIQ
jgi:hypothetical protein